MAFVMMVLLLLTAVFLVLLVLIQRGKGGGLAGAFGGMGGQSAFGTKAGDLFTKVTIVVAAFWIILCLIAVHFFGGSGNDVFDPNLGGGDPVKGGVAAPPPTEQQPPDNAQPGVPEPSKQDGN